MPYVAGALSILWTGYFLYAAFRLYGRWHLMREYFGPFYPREQEPTVHAVMAALDWRVPLGMASLPLVAFMAWRVYRFVLSQHYRGRNKHTSRHFPTQRQTIQSSIMQTTPAYSIVTPKHRWWESPWLWLFIGAMAGMYRIGPGGWSDVPLSMAEQLRLAAGVLFVSFALETRRKWWTQGLFVLFGVAAFGLTQRSFGYYPELILLVTLVLVFGNRWWLAAAFLLTATAALMLFVLASPYRVDQLANMSMDWLDSSREGHAAYDAMQQNVRLGGWFGTVAPEPATLPTDSEASRETWVSWQLAAFCLKHGSAPILAWIAIVGALFYWLTQRLRQIAEGGFRTALFVLAILFTGLAIQPVLEIHGGLPRWMAAHPIFATVVSLVSLAFAVFANNRNHDKVRSDLPRSWRLILGTTIGLAGTVFIAHVVLVVGLNCA